MPHLTALLDANVLYSAGLRDEHFPDAIVTDYRTLAAELGLTPTASLLGTREIEI